MGCDLDRPNLYEAEVAIDCPGRTRGLSVADDFWVIRRGGGLSSRDFDCGIAPGPKCAKYADKLLCSAHGLDGVDELFGAFVSVPVCEGTHPRLGPRVALFERGGVRCRGGDARS